jgi:hypothetical protein
VNTLIAGSTGTLTYTPDHYPATSITVALTDAAGAAIAIAATPVAVAATAAVPAHYTLSIASSELATTLIGKVCTAVWTWTFGGSTRRDVEYFYVTESELFPALREYLSNRIS